MENRILYVEDDEGEAYLVKARLKQRGLEVDVAQTGELAGEQFDPQRHLLSVIDWNLPDAPAINVATALRAIDPGCRIIFISGVFTDQLLELAAAMQPLACITKDTDFRYTEAIYRLAQQPADGEG